MQSRPCSSAKTVCRSWQFLDEGPSHEMTKTATPATNRMCNFSRSLSLRPVDFYVVTIILFLLFLKDFLHICRVYILTKPGII